LRAVLPHLEWLIGAEVAQMDKRHLLVGLTAAEAIGIAGVVDQQFTPDVNSVVAIEMSASTKDWPPDHDMIT
jgi:hypothetical protein